MRPPSPIQDYVVAFAKRVAPRSNTAPFYVSCRPLQGVPYGECFPVVDSHARRYGGKVGLGWAIWERPGVFIEAEFHAVWVVSGTQILDIAPRPYDIPRILFLPDVHRLYEGVQVDNVREALVDDPDVKRFLYLAAERFNVTNEGELKKKHGTIENTPQLVAIDEEMIATECKLIERYGWWLPEDAGGTN